MLYFPHGFMGTPQLCTTLLAVLSISNQIVKGGKLFCTEKEFTKITISPFHLLKFEANWSSSECTHNIIIGLIEYVANVSGASLSWRRQWQMVTSSITVYLANDSWIGKILKIFTPPHLLLSFLPSIPSSVPLTTFNFLFISWFLFLCFLITMP